jgi:hypothetical protein
MMKRVFIVLLMFGALFFTQLTEAQGLPGTKVWLVDVEDGIPVGALLISSENGYNNQPMFQTDRRISPAMK